MAKIEVYTSPFCGYCHRVKHLLDAKGVAYQEYDVLAEPDRRVEMTRRAGGRQTVPQVFVDGRHVGDCDGLHALEAKGRLDAVLKGSAGTP